MISQTHKLLLAARTIVTATILLLLSLPSHATLDTKRPLLTNNSPLGGPEILNVALSTILVIGAVLFVGWLVSRVRNIGHANGDMINVVSSKALGAKERLMLIEVGDKHLLIGMTSTQVQTLHVFDQPIPPKELPAEATGFAQRLRTAIRSAGK